MALGVRGIETTAEQGESSYSGKKKKKKKIPTRFP